MHTNVEATAPRFKQDARKPVKIDQPEILETPEN